MVRVSNQGKVVISPREHNFWFAWEFSAAWEGIPLAAWKDDPLPITLAWDGLEFL